MIVILALARAFRLNSEFQPYFLYLGAFIIDMAIVEALLS